MRRGTSARRTIAVTLASCLAVLGGAGCGTEAAREDAEADGGGRGAPAAGAAAEERGRDPARVALPGLFGIMVALEEETARLDRGLWRSEWDTVAAGASAVADHPRIPPSERQKLAAALGGDMSRFAALDTRVHDAAVRIRSLADQEDAGAVLSASHDLREGCLTCHEEFRQRVRDAHR